MSFNHLKKPQGINANASEVCTSVHINRTKREHLEPSQWANNRPGEREAQRVQTQDVLAGMMERLRETLGSLGVPKLGSGTG